MLFRITGALALIMAMAIAAAPKQVAQFFISPKLVTAVHLDGCTRTGEDEAMCSKVTVKFAGLSVKPDPEVIGFDRSNLTAAAPRGK